MRVIVKEASKEIAVNNDCCYFLNYETEHGIYQEAFLDGRYIFAGYFASGFPLSQARIYREATKLGPRGAVWNPLNHLESAFQLEIDGKLLQDGWLWLGHEELNSSESKLEHLVKLRHENSSILLTIHTCLDKTGFIVRWLEIENDGDTNLVIAKAKTWSGRIWKENITGTDNLSDAIFSLGKYKNKSPHMEGKIQWHELQDGKYGFGSCKGHSGWRSPFMIIRNRITGENFISHLAWSGNWEFDLIVDEDAGANPKITKTSLLYGQLGLCANPPLCILAPKETISTPKVHLAVIYGSLDDWVNSLHSHIRGASSGTCPPVSYNHCSYQGVDKTSDETVLKELEIAAKIGAELFIIDAGWYGSDMNLNWRQRRGDWHIESPKFKSGLKGIFKEIHKKNLKGGLWCEIEALSKLSETGKNHPDWFMKRRGRSMEIIDLTNPEVIRHLEKTIRHLIDSYELDCFRIDFNLLPGEGGERVVDGCRENTLWRYYNNLYKLFDDIRAEYPNLLLENCAAGGGRNDLGMLSRFNWGQMSDNSIPREAISILDGMSIAFPPEKLTALLGAILWNPTGDTDFISRIGMFGQFCLSGIAPDINEIHPHTLTRLQHNIELYKSFIRPLFNQGTIYHHSQLDNDFRIIELAGKNSEKACIGIWNLGSKDLKHLKIIPKGLKLAEKYQVTWESAGQKLKIPGFKIMSNGIHTLTIAQGTSEFILIENYCGERDGK